MDIYTAAGLVGFAAYVAAFGLVQTDKIDGNGSCYSAVNIVAAVLVLVSLSQDFNLPSALIQVTWITLGLVGMLLRWSAPAVEPAVAVEHQAAVAH